MRNEYSIQGIPISHLAETFGTPSYFYDGNILEDTFQTLRRALPSAMDIFYSLKANPNISIYNLLRSMGAYAEVCSLTELMTVLQCATEPENIIFLGPGKTIDEIEACIDHDIYAIVCESLQELELIDVIASQKGKIARVALRVNPSFTVKGSRLTMGGKPRQFGIDEQILLDSGPLLTRYEHVHLIGTHTYMGTRILDEEEVYQNTLKILSMAEKLAEAIGFDLEMVDVGGGLGVPYFEGEASPDIHVLGEKMTPLIEAFHNRHPKTRLIMELGRYLVGRSGVFVSKSLYVKESMGESFVVTDGGTNCHMAAVGIGSVMKRNFPIRLLNDMEGAPVASYNVTGPLCTPNDLVGKLVPLPDVQPGDLIGVFNSGAYGPTASPVQFLSHGYPAEVLIHRGQSLLIRSRDRYQDLLNKQHLHTFQKQKGNEGFEMNEIIEKITRTLVDVLELDDSTVILPSTQLFEELNLDSTSIIDLIISLEDAFEGLNIEQGDLEPKHFETVESLSAFVLTHSDVVVER
ncbi:MAG: hypothetical protein WCC10_00390 [Tumebacillaceae bacterium]